MTAITCPACRQTHEIDIDITEAMYQAPFHCPRCLGLYFVVIEDNALISCEPLTESGYARWKMAQTSREAND